MSFAGTPFNRDQFACVTIDTMANWIDRLSEALADDLARHSEYGECLFCDHDTNHYADCDVLFAQQLRERLMSEERKLTRLSTPTS